MEHAAINELILTNPPEAGGSTVVTRSAPAWEATREQREQWQKAFAVVQVGILRWAKSKGWWEEQRNGGELVALAHSELSELLEALRHGNPPSKKLEGYVREDGLPFSHAEEEIADVFIRLMDWAEMAGWDIAGAVLAKMDYNQTRPYRHGGKAF